MLIVKWSGAARDDNTQVKIFFNKYKDGQLFYAVRGQGKYDKDLFTVTSLSPSDVNYGSSDYIRCFEEELIVIEWGKELKI